jgi:hypothetical protein
MTNAEKIEFAMRQLAGIRVQNGGRANTQEESRQAQPHRELRPQLEKDLFPDTPKKERGGRER